MNPRLRSISNPVRPGNLSRLHTSLPPLTQGAFFQPHISPPPSPSTSPTTSPTSSPTSPPVSLISSTTSTSSPPTPTSSSPPSLDTLSLSSTTSSPSPLTPLDRAHRLLEVIHTVLEGYGRRRTCPAVHLEALRHYLHRAQDLCAADTWRVVSTSPSPSPSSSSDELGDIIYLSSPPTQDRDPSLPRGRTRAEARRASETSAAEAADRLAQLEDEWWNSQVAAIWFGPRPRPKSRAPGAASSACGAKQLGQRMVREKTPMLHRDASYVGLNDE